MSFSYFSDSEGEPRPRSKEDFPKEAWGGIFAYITSCIDRGAFGFKYPENCNDSGRCIPYGTNEGSFWLAVRGDIPDFPYEIGVTTIPNYLIILDFIEFCFHSIGKPKVLDYHNFLGHHHLAFDQKTGQKEFCEAINQIFSRHEMAYELTPSGTIKRLCPEILRESLSKTLFCSGDHCLDELLESARKKYLSPDLTIRKDALEKLWDAWERIKTLEPPIEDKSKSLAKLIEKTSRNSEFQKLLDNDGRELTLVGNKFHIRHFETTKIPLEGSEHLDYLFSRMFALIHLFLKKTGRCR